MWVGGKACYKLGAIVVDGADRAIVTWFKIDTDYNIYAHREESARVVHTDWPDNGHSLCTANKNQVSPTIVEDRAAGDIVTRAHARIQSHQVAGPRVDVVRDGDDVDEVRHDGR